MVCDFEEWPVNLYGWLHPVGYGYCCLRIPMLVKFACKKIDPRNTYQLEGE